MQVELRGDTDLAGFRAHARALLQQGVAPDAVHWRVAGSDGDLLATDPHAPAAPAAAAAKVPAFFLELCQSVVLHREAQRFALLYRLLWRLAHESALRRDPLDADILLARQMARQVGHDIHKMRAFVRFRPVDDGHAGGPLHVAWFEPQHYIVEANAPWFQRRFTNMRWALMTPDLCADWDGEALRFGPGADKSAAPAADDGEALWLTYYRSIFNPARLKLAMMRKEMPRRYWANLPEAVLIAPLAQEAHERGMRMVEEAPTQPLRRIRPLEQPARALPAAGTRAGLGAATDACRACPLGAHATQAVHGEGPAGAALMIVGEQPGDQEDLHGKPFVGPAGQLLDRALQQAGIDRGQAFLTNAVRHFKFELRGKRRIHKTPSVAEASACLQWLEQEIALVRPQALVALGATAARALLGRPVAVLKERGQWLARDDGLQVFVTLHPSALLRMEPQAQPGAFSDFVRDLAAASRRFAPSPGGRGLG